MQTNPLQIIQSTYPATKRLFDIPRSEFETGSLFSEAIKLAGFTDSAISTISQNWWWSLTVKEFCEEIEKMIETTTDAA